MRKILVLISAGLFLLPCATAQRQNSNTELRHFLETFIRSFDNLDWETFRQSFSDDATVFYPRAIPERANGRAEFEKNFKVVFAQIRNGKAAPPYMDIRPRSMTTALFGNIAIVTFHLDDRVGVVNRRTIVLVRTAAGWKIVHLHASEVATGH